MLALILLAVACMWVGTGLAAGIALLILAYGDELRVRMTAARIRLGAARSRAACRCGDDAPAPRRLLRRRPRLGRLRPAHVALCGPFANCDATSDLETEA